MINPGQTPVIRRLVLALFLVILAAPAHAAELSDLRFVETASLPGLKPPDLRGLPQVLGAGDARLYRLIFTRQQAGDWAAADALIEQISDTRLMGHVLFQRLMHPTAYRASYQELKSWLALYRDQPGADRIYRLAMHRRPKGADAPVKPEDDGPLQIIVGSLGQAQLSDAFANGDPKVWRTVLSHIADGRLAESESYLAAVGKGGPHAPEAVDAAYALLSRGYYHQKNDSKAYDLADKAARRSGDAAPETHWVAGLAAWRLGPFSEALPHFVAVADNAKAPATDRAASAYWAARTALRLGRPAEMSRWLRTAAGLPRTFYGLVARQTLGIDDRRSLRGLKFDSDALEALLSNRRIARAVALLQVGQDDLARAEFGELGGRIEPGQLEALLLLLDRARMAPEAYEIADKVFRHVGEETTYGVIDVGLYPIPSWQPTDGFRVDRALLFAIARKESRFDPDARNPSGASGLMQLMPLTARAMAEKGEGKGRLLEPDYNMELAQRYVEHLQQDPVIRDDLLKLLVGYNAGPGNLRRWQAQLGEAGENDPLLFMESLPSRETRSYLRRVLANYWIYRKRLGQPTPSLASIAAGEWPAYESLD